MIALLTIPTYILGWFIYENCIRSISGDHFSEKWSSNLVSATHSLLMVVSCMLAVNSKIDPINIFSISSAYFIYDIQNYSFGTLFFVHHIFSLIAIIHASKFVPNLMITMACYGFTELGNFPLYVMYCMLNHHNKVYLSRWYKIVLVWEFIWFIIFRIAIVGWISTYLVDPISIFLACVLQIANIKWTFGLFGQIQKAFFPMEPHICDPNSCIDRECWIKE